MLSKISAEFIFYPRSGFGVEPAGCFNGGVGHADEEWANMKNLGFAVLLGIALLAPVAKADPGNQNGCVPSGDKPKKCDPAPVAEPGITIFVGAGLLALSGYAFARRKQKLN